MIMGNPPRAKKLPPRKPRVTSPALDFALSGEMITKEEYDACLLGNMALDKQRLINLNHPNHPTLLTGQTAEIFFRRGLEISMAVLLGQKPKCK